MGGFSCQGAIVRTLSRGETIFCDGPLQAKPGEVVSCDANRLSLPALTTARDLYTIKNDE